MPDQPLITYVPVGNLGYGYPEASLDAVRDRRFDVIGIDAGSTDPGPYYLGSGESFTSRIMVAHDLSRALVAARAAGVPLLVGTAGGAGAEPHLADLVNIVHAIAARERLAFRLAVIHAQIPAAVIKAAVSAGRVDQFEAARPLAEEDVDGCPNIVAQMGVEPFIAALRGGADVVIAGRAFDAAITAAYPISRGFDAGLAYHMGKIVECGSLVATPRAHDGVLAEMHDDHFIVEPADPEKRCTVELVAAHTLYEKSNPYLLGAPGGVLDLRQSRFEQVDARRVCVSGSKFVPDPVYRIKLEGARRVGSRAVCLAGIRDPGVIRNLSMILDSVRAKVHRDLGTVIPAESYQLLFRIYGVDAVMGPWEPAPVVAPQEVALLVEVVAPTQQEANTICSLARSATLHAGFEGRKSTGGNLAFPFSPAEFAGPAAYEFAIYHLMEVDDAESLFPIEWFEMDGSTTSAA